MKARIKEIQEPYSFKPIKLEIDITSLDELTALQHLMGSNISVPLIVYNSGDQQITKRAQLDRYMSHIFNVITKDT